MEPEMGYIIAMVGLQMPFNATYPGKLCAEPVIQNSLEKKFLLVVGLYNRQNQRINVVNQKIPIFFRLSDRYYYE